MADGYQERPATLPGGAIWTRRDPDLVPPGERFARVLPDGCIDLIWTAGRILVAGPDTRAHLVPVRPGSSHVGLRMPPGVGPAVLGVPAHLLRDQRIPLAQIWPRLPARGLAEAGVEPLEEQLAAAPDPDLAGAVLDDVVRRRMAGAVDPHGRSTVPDPVLGHVVSVLRRSGSVAQAAAAVGLGERQLHRRCLVAFGYGPQMLARILRLGRALDLVRRGVPAATAAAMTGYADQPHLAREVRRLAGVPLSQLITRRARAGPSGTRAGDESSTPASPRRQGRWQSGRPW